MIQSPILYTTQTVLKRVCGASDNMFKEVLDDFPVRHWVKYLIEGIK